MGPFLISLPSEFFPSRSRERASELGNDFEDFLGRRMGIIGEKKPKSSSSPSSTSPCADLRAAYHNCFNKWYSEKFVKGQWQKEECDAEWRKYRACLSEHLEDKHLSRFLEAEGLGSTTGADSASAADGAETNPSD